MYNAIKTTRKRDINGNSFITGIMQNMDTVYRHKQHVQYQYRIEDNHLMVAREVLHKAKLFSDDFSLLPARLSDSEMIFTVIEDANDIEWN